MPRSASQTASVAYKPWREELPNILLHFVKGPMLATLFLWFVACNDRVLPSVLRWASLEVDWCALPGAAWLDDMFGDRLAARGSSVQELLVFLAISLVVHEAVYFTLNPFFYMCDTFKLLQQYKLPRPARTKLPPGLLRSTLTLAFINHIIVQPVVFCIVYVYGTSFPSLLDPATAHRRCGVKPYAAAAPPFAGAVSYEPIPTSVVEVYLHMFMAHLVNNFGFYWFHRLCHAIPMIYINFHKDHHRYVGTIGFAGEYASAFEQVLVNEIPTAGYCLLLSRWVHPSIWFVWLGWRVWESDETHSGYDFSSSFLGRIGLLYGHEAKVHDWHHVANDGNFGSYPMDYMFGTMDSFVQSHEANKKNEDTTVVLNSVKTTKRGTTPASPSKRKAV